MQIIVLELSSTLKTYHRIDIKSTLQQNVVSECFIPRGLTSNDLSDRNNERRISNIWVQSHRIEITQVSYKGGAQLFSEIDQFCPQGCSWPACYYFQSNFYLSACLYILYPTIKLTPKKSPATLQATHQIISVPQQGALLIYPAVLLQWSISPHFEQLYQQQNDLPSQLIHVTNLQQQSKQWAGRQHTIEGIITLVNSNKLNKLIKDACRLSLKGVQLLSKERNEFWLDITTIMIVQFLQCLSQQHRIIPSINGTRTRPSFEQCGTKIELDLLYS